MAFDPQVQLALDAAAQRFREDLAQQTQALAQQIQASAEAERDRAIADARDAAERVAATRLIDAVAAAEAEAKRAGRDEGFQDGIKKGRQQGHVEGFEQGRAEGREEGRTLGREQGVSVGRAEGRQLGLDEGRKVGREEGRAEGLEAGREKGRQEGIQTGREEGWREAESKVKTAVKGAVAATRAAVDSAEHAARERLLDAVRNIGRATTLSDVFDALVKAASREAPQTAVLLVHGNEVRQWRDQTAKRPTAMVVGAIRTGLPVSQPNSHTIPMSVGGHVVAVLTAGATPSATSATTLELLARFSSRCLEAVTASKTARLFPASPTRGNSAQSGVSVAVRPEDLASARRYAKLLVSEIKLYHEADVATGQRLRDLGTRLGGEIARARALFEQRVPPNLRQREDPFYEELVRTLANGDETLLDVRT